MPAPSSVRTVAVVGTGVIGGGWAAHFLRMGYDVVAYDPYPSRVAELVANAWPALSQLGLADGASPSRLSVVDSLAAAVSTADFVQESTPEDLAAKVEVLRTIDLHTPTDVVVASSTSGFAMTDMQVSCVHPERFVVGHPFNPPYLIPLVEVVGGASTDPASVSWAASFYALAGKKPLVMDHELPGFIGNRLQEAMWREALHMVAAEEATVTQIDASIAYGPGLRWAQMGPCLTFHLAGGQGGMAHMLDHFGPALLEPWTRLSAPPLTPGCAPAWSRGAKRRRPGSRSRSWRGGGTLFSWTCCCCWRSMGYETRVRAEWIDYNGHMTDAAYAVVCSEASEAFLASVDLSADYQAATGCTTYTVESHIHYLREAVLDDVVTVETVILDTDLKRLRLGHTLRTSAGDIARAELLYLHVNQRTGRVEPFPAKRRERLARLRT
ncbi:hypothetical protein GCM10029964_075340 [Kibdelosporangium lantanae]